MPGATWSNPGARHAVALSAMRRRTLLRPAPASRSCGTIGCREVDHLRSARREIPGAVLIDADVFTDDMVSLVTPVKDHPAFWRFLAKVADEISQNDLVVVYFSVMLPGQLLANADVVDYFESVSFLCLTCDAGVLRQRLTRRVGAWTDTQTIDEAVDRWHRFNEALVDAAGRTEDALMIDASRSVSEVEPDVRDRVLTRLQNYPEPGTR